MYATQHRLKKTGPGLQFESGFNFKKYPRIQTEVQANAQLFLHHPLATGPKHNYINISYTK
jgi:hypothetical protein